MATFRVKRTGTILHTDNEEVIAMMTSSPAYVRIDIKPAAEPEQEPVQEAPKPKPRKKKVTKTEE